MYKCVYFYLQGILIHHFRYIELLFLVIWLLLIFSSMKVFYEAGKNLEVRYNLGLNLTYAVC